MQMKRWIISKLSRLDRGTIHDTAFADYMTHSGGMLVFKKRAAHGYPEVVAVYAPGRWLDVVAA